MAYAKAMDALGDPTRRAVFERLRKGPVAVVDIAHDLPVSRPAVSQHLKVLKDAGLVSDRQVGNRRLYRIEPRALAEVHTYWEGLWSDALANFARAVEAGDERGDEQ